MKINYNHLKSALFSAGLFAISFAKAQCPAITCPGNQTVNNTPGTCGAVVTYVTPVGVNPCGTGSQTFNYTGAVQTFTVPAGVTSLTIDMSGAQGGLSYYVGVGGPGGHIAGLGGRVQATWAVTPGQVYNIYVGQKGLDGGAVGAAGGYNGGGTGGTYQVNQGGGGGGGGASDIRFGGNALANRIFVAGGGGGAAYNYTSGDDGGNGGGLIGLNGETNNNANDPSDGFGGTQGAGGAAGVRGNPWLPATAGALGTGGNAGSNGIGGGGAGGYYGGGGGCFAGGGGGSSYTDPGAGNVAHTQGFKTGNGQVIISYVGGGATTTQTAGLPSGATFPVGVTTNTFQVNDGLGNIASCSFTVTVVDNENPAIAAPANITVNNDPGVCGAVVNFNAPVGTDNCAVTTALTSGMASGSTFPVGTTTETYTATDASGNTASASFTITVVDNESPVITCPANISVNNDAGSCGAVVTFNAPVGTDNCSATTSLTAGMVSGSTFPIGVTTQTYTATDPAGLTTSCSFTITVVDNEVPAISCSGNVTSCVGVVNGIAPTNSSDNCVGTTITYALTGATTGNGNTDASGTTFNTGTTSVTYTITDASGNTASCSFDVLVNPSYNVSATAAICQGGSIVLGGAVQTQAGTYIDSLSTNLGCDSVISTVLTVNPLPTVTLGAFANDTVCITVAPFALPAGTPAGGGYTGQGVVGNNFSPSAAGVGSHYVVYNYSDANGCQNADSAMITVSTCSGIAENTILQPSVYPNPTNGQVMITLGGTYKAVEVSVLEMNGRVVMTNKFNYTSTVTNDLGGLATGMYFLQIKADGQSTMVKIVKN